MKKSTKIRLAGSVIIIINLVIIGFLNLKGPIVLVMTVGLAAFIEFVFVRPAIKAEEKL